MNIMKRIASSFVVGGGPALLPQRRTKSEQIDIAPKKTREEMLWFPDLVAGVRNPASAGKQREEPSDGRCPNCRIGRDRHSAGAAEGGGGRRHPRTDRDHPARPVAAGRDLRAS